MSTALVDSAETAIGTLTWWHRGWLEYALRLDTADGTHEAVEDSWFAALATIARELPVDLPLPDPVRAEHADQHREQWTRWVRETLG